MKRTDITEIFPDATAEQLDKIMGLNGTDVNAIRAQLTEAQAQLAAMPTYSAAELAKAKEDVAKLQKQLDDMNAAEAVRQIREKVATEQKIPVSLLTGDTEEACAAQAKAILDFASSSGYPAVVDGGEPVKTGAPTTRAQFANWAKELL